MKNSNNNTATLKRHENKERFTALLFADRFIKNSFVVNDFMTENTQVFTIVKKDGENTDHDSISQFLFNQLFKIKNDPTAPRFTFFVGYSKLTQKLRVFISLA